MQLRCHRGRLSGAALLHKSSQLHSIVTIGALISSIFFTFKFRNETLLAKYLGLL